MDLQFTDVRPTDAELDALDHVLGIESAAIGTEGGPAWERDHGGLHRARGRRHLLLNALWALQDRVGFISEGGLGELARRLDVPPSEAYGTASFYGLFNLSPAPPVTVHVCTDLACAMLSAQDVLEAAQQACVGRDDRVRTLASPCLGLCERAPAALVSEAGRRAHEAVLAPATPTSVEAAITLGVGAVKAEVPAENATPQLRTGDSAELVLLRRIGVADPTSIDSYRAHGGYSALAAALKMGPAGVVSEITAANLLGRGGAAFPAGRKWAAVALQAALPHYLVCNADESEPGTFKDRVVMEGDPFAVVEAMTIAAFATGCTRGYIYLRGEYPRAGVRLRHAITAAQAAGMLGNDIMGSGFDFDIEIVRGAGAYICGEETAIFNSIEGFRGEPRSKPPFPVEVGLFGKPTLVNNVETLINVLPIILGGGENYARIGTSGSSGQKLFCVSGSVANPGVYEVPFGVTLRELIALAGGMRAGATLRAVLLGGAAGSFVSPDQLDMPLTFEGARAGGATLGSGVVLVIDDTVEIAPLLRSIAGFFRSESCGQCVPCRVGTVRQEETLHRLTVSGARPGDMDLLREIGQAMRDSSICGLGQTAWNAIESAFDRLEISTVVAINNGGGTA
jgi:NADH-quinone oxidoreductase subunit F